MQRCTQIFIFGINFCYDPEKVYGEPVKEGPNIVVKTFPMENFVELATSGKYSIADVVYGAMLVERRCGFARILAGICQFVKIRCPSSVM